MENKYEKLLNIHTEGMQEKFNEIKDYFIYEPTSYYVLESLLTNYPLLKTDSVVDFGSGKGRLNFFIHYHFKCQVTGIEMNQDYYNDALENLESYRSSHDISDHKINFINCTAEEYEIQNTDNKFYFFNPFSVKIFIKVVLNIIFSTFENDRPVDIILFYPHEDYINFLDNYTDFELFKEIKLFPQYYNDNREKVLIYRLT